MLYFFRILRLVKLSILLLYLGCTGPRSPIRVGISPWPAFELLHLASELGYYDDAPIQIVDYHAQQDVQRAYSAGSIDVVALNATDALMLAAHGSQDKIILVLDLSHGADAIIAKPEIHNARELKGKRVGLEKIALEYYMLTRALEQVNLAPSDVQMKPLELSSQVEAFKKKQVDAIVTFEPVRSQLIALGGREIFSSGQIAGEVADILITRRELIMNRKKELQKLIYGWFKALEYLKQHPLDVARRVATSREGISPDQYLKSFHGFTIPDLQENRRLLSGPTPTFRTQLRQILKVLVSFQVIKSSIDPGTYLDDQLIKASSP